MHAPSAAASHTLSMPIPEHRVRAIQFAVFCNAASEHVAPLTSRRRPAQSSGIRPLMLQLIAHETLSGHDVHRRHAAHTSSIVVADELRSMSTRRAERGRGAAVRLSASSSATSRAICASVVNSVEKSLKLEGSFGPRFRFTSGGATSRSGLRANRLFLVRCLELVRWSSVVGDSAIMRSSTATSRPAPAPGHKATQSLRTSRYFVNMIYARQRSERGPASRRRLQDSSPAPEINAFTFEPGKSHLSALRTPQYHAHDTNDSTVAWHRGKSRLLNSASRIVAGGRATSDGKKYT